MSGNPLIGVAPCWSCGVSFSFDVDTVPSVPIDPVTNRPPDLGGLDARAVKQPICPGCCRLVNERRAELGHTHAVPLREDDTAETAIRTVELP